MKGSFRGEIWWGVWDGWILCWLKLKDVVNLLCLFNSMLFFSLFEHVFVESSLKSFQLHSDWSVPFQKNVTIDKKYVQRIHVVYKIQPHLNLVVWSIFICVLLFAVCKFECIGELPKFSNKFKDWKYLTKTSKYI